MPPEATVHESMTLPTCRTAGASPADGTYRYDTVDAFTVTALACKVTTRTRSSHPTYHLRSKQQTLRKNRRRALFPGVTCSLVWYEIDTVGDYFLGARRLFVAE